MSTKPVPLGVYVTGVKGEDILTMTKVSDVKKFPYKENPLDTLKEEAENEKRKNPDNPSLASYVLLR